MSLCYNEELGGYAAIQERHTGKVLDASSPITWPRISGFCALSSCDIIACGHQSCEEDWICSDRQNSSIARRLEHRFPCPPEQRLVAKHINRSLARLAYGILCFGRTSRRPRVRRRHVCMEPWVILPCGRGPTAHGSNTKYARTDVTSPNRHLFPCWCLARISCFSAAPAVDEWYFQLPPGWIFNCRQAGFSQFHRRELVVVAIDTSYDPPNLAHSGTNGLRAFKNLHRE